MVQRPLEHICGKVVTCGENVTAGADRKIWVDQYGSAAGDGADVVEVELEQFRILVRGGQPDREGIEWIIAARWGVGDVPVGDVVASRFSIRRCDKRDQYILGVDDQVAQQISHQPAGTPGR